MQILTLADLLAQTPESTVYVHPAKLISIVVLFVGWIFFAQWVDKDTGRVNTFRTIWNSICIGCGTLGLIMLLVLPIFWAAIAAYIVIVGALMIAYVIHRNGLVVEDDKVCTPEHFRKLLREGFKGGKAGKKDIEVKERVRLTGADGQVVLVPQESEEKRIYGLAQDLLFDAILRRAGRVDIVPKGQASRIRFMIHGEPNERDPLERADGDRIIGFLKGITGLNLEERRKPQRGQIMAAIADHRYDLIVRTNGSTAGEALSIRVIGDEKSYKIDDLGFTAKQLETVQRLQQQDHGMILLSAPAGQGLTTSVYSFTRSNDAFLLNIQTLEYEIEIPVDNITQRVFTPSDDRSFMDDLLKIVRSDPDVIVLPTIRDRAAAEVAAEAAAKKQRVYVGINASDVFDALRRWLASVPDTKLIANSLLAVFHQRLARVLCPACKTPYKPQASRLAKMNMPKDQVLHRKSEQQFDKHGKPVLCQNCQGVGYAGRTGVFDILVIDDPLRKVIAQGGSLADIKAAAKGKLSLQQQALQKVMTGVTSVEEAARVTQSPQKSPKRPARSEARKPAPQPKPTSM